MRVAPPRGDQHQRRPGPLRGRPGPGRLHQRRPAHGSRRTTSTPGSTRIGADLVDPVLPPAVDRRRPDRGAGRRRRRRDRRPARRRQRATGRHARRPAGAVDASTSSPAGRRPTRRTASSPRAATPVRCRRCAEGRAGCRTKARSWSRWPSRPLRSKAPTCAGSTCAPGPVGKAALLAALAAAARRPRWWPTSCSPIGPTWYDGRWARRPRSRRRGGPTRAGRRGGDRGRRHRSAVAAGLLRPGPGRRALHRAGCPPPPARGPVAQAAGRPRVAGPAPACAARRRAGPGPARGRGPLRDLLAGRSPRPATSSARCWSSATT